MLDELAWDCVANILDAAEAKRNPRGRGTPQDKLGQIHIVVFMDVKQLPPATNLPVFLVRPDVHTNFRFMTLRENRRLVQGNADRASEMESFPQNPKTPIIYK